MRRSLTKHERIRGKEVTKAFTTSKRRSVPGCSLRYSKNGLSYNRVLFSLGRKYGNSVQRNYTKRIGKELFRHLKPYLLTGYDLVFIFYSGDYTYQDRFIQIAGLMNQSGILKKECLDPNFVFQILPGNFFHSLDFVHPKETF